MVLVIRPRLMHAIVLFSKRPPDLKITCRPLLVLQNPPNPPQPPQNLAGRNRITIDPWTVIARHVACGIWSKVNLMPTLTPVIFGRSIQSFFLVIGDVLGRTSHWNPVLRSVEPSTLDLFENAGWHTLNRSPVLPSVSVLAEWLNPT